MAIENRALQEKIDSQKRAQQNGRGLFDELRAKGEQRALIFSPNKFQEAKELQRQRDQAKEDEAARIAQKKVDQAINKATKDREMAERREQRAIAKAIREEGKQAAKEARSEALEAKAADRQLQIEAKAAKKAPKKPASKATVATSSNSAPTVATSEVKVFIARSRRGRQIKPPQRFDN